MKTDEVEISLESFAAEAARIFSRQTAIDHRDVLREILNALKPVNFHELGNLTDSERISQKHYRVLTLREIIRVTHELNLGLARHGDFVYAYNGQFWKLLELQEIEHFLAAASEVLGLDYITARDYAYRERLVKQFLADAYLPVPEPTEGPVLVNLANGTFEVVAEGGKLREFRRDDFLTYRLPFNFLPEADCPRWTTFLDEVLPDRSKQAVLAEYFAYVFVRQFTLEKTLLLYGTGANGKSVVFRVINAMLGEENVTNYGLEALCNDYYRAKIANSLLNYSSDISNRLQAEKFKLITSGEPIEARLPYGQPMILKRYARLAFNCNELPKDVEHTEAYFRRFLIIHFDQFIPEENRNPTLASEIIDTELPGVFNWVLQGLDRLLASKAFSPCAAAQESLKWYKTESDSVAMFLADEGYGRSETSQPVKGVYRDYREYCGDNGYRPLGRNNFGKRLQHIGIPILRTRLGLEAHLARDLFSGDNVTTSPGHATGWSL